MMAVNTQLPLQVQQIDTATPLAALSNGLAEKQQQDFQNARQTALDAQNAKTTAQELAIKQEELGILKVKNAFEMGTAKQQQEFRNTAIDAIKAKSLLGNPTALESFLFDPGHPKGGHWSDLQQAYKQDKTPDKAMFKNLLDASENLAYKVGALEPTKGTTPVTLGQGETLVDPTTGKAIATGQPKSAAIPSGYQPAATGAGLEPIPGGPVDLKMKAAQQKQDQLKQDGIAKAQLINTAVRESLDLLDKHPMLDLSTGTAGWALQHIGGTDAFKLREAISPITANLGFDELQKMRAASPTGGALGQVSERELGFLQAAVTSLSQGQDKATLKKHLEAVQKHYNNWLDVVKAAPPSAFSSVGNGEDQNAPGANPYSGMSNEQLLQELNK